MRLLLISVNLCFRDRPKKDFVSRDCIFVYIFISDEDRSIRFNTSQVKWCIRGPEQCGITTSFMVYHKFTKFISSNLKIFYSSKLRKSLNFARGNCCRLNRTEFKEKKLKVETLRDVSSFNSCSTLPFLRSENLFG